MNGGNRLHPANSFHLIDAEKGSGSVPQHLLGTQVGQTPPQVIHYHGQRGGSQANTPTLLVHQDVGIMRRGSQDVTARKGDANVTEALETLPDAKLESPDYEEHREDNMDLDS